MVSRNGSNVSDEKAREKRQGNSSISTSDVGGGLRASSLRLIHGRKDHSSRSGSGHRGPSTDSKGLTAPTPSPPSNDTVSTGSHGDAGSRHPSSPPRYHFGCLLSTSMPPVPPGLLARTTLSGSGVDRRSSLTAAAAGNVKVILCVRLPNGSTDSAKGSSTSGVSSQASNVMPSVSIDPRRKQVTLIHPAPSRRRFSLAAPKMFAFDAVLTQEDPLAEVCSLALTDAVYSVVHGTDSCVLSLGHSKTGKTWTMLGSDKSTSTAGVVQIASRLNRLRRRRVGNSTPSHGSAPGGSSLSGTTSDDTSSSVDSHGMRKISSSRFRGPRLGRSSFSYRSGASDAEYTSSSEQSCDTVIYLGSRQERGLGIGASSDSGSDRYQLGPRGPADGSVGRRALHSADEYDAQTVGGHREDSEEGEEHCPTLESKGRTRNSKSVSFSDGGTLRVSSGFCGLGTAPIKRVAPRTNATAWPRAAAVRKGKELLTSKEETWVDGPNAMVVQELPVTATGVSVASETVSVGAAPQTQLPLRPPPPPAPPYHNFAHRIVPQQQPLLSSTRDVAEGEDSKDGSAAFNPAVCSQSSDISVCGQRGTVLLSPSDAPKEEARTADISPIETPQLVDSTTETCIPSTATTATTIIKDALQDAPLGDGDWPSDSEASSNESASSSGSSSESDSSLPKNSRNCRNRGFGVLSDISERTEETETTAPSSLRGQCERNSVSTLLDLALQQSRLISAEKDSEEIKREAAWPCLPPEEVVFGSPQLSFLKLNGDAMTVENVANAAAEPPPYTSANNDGSHHKETRQTCTNVLDEGNSVPPSEKKPGQEVVGPAYREESTASSSLTQQLSQSNSRPAKVTNNYGGRGEHEVQERACPTENTRPKKSSNCLECRGHHHSPRKRDEHSDPVCPRTPQTSSSFDRVAAWVKDVSSDLVSSGNTLDGIQSTHLPITAYGTPDRRRRRTNSGDHSRGDGCSQGCNDEVRHRHHHKNSRHRRSRSSRHQQHHHHCRGRQNEDSTCAKCREQLCCVCESCSLATANRENGFDPCDQKRRHSKLRFREAPLRDPGSKSEGGKQGEERTRSRDVKLQQQDLLQQPPPPTTSPQIMPHHSHLQRHPSDLSISHNCSALPISTIQRTASCPWVAGQIQRPTSTTVGQPACAQAFDPVLFRQHQQMSFSQTPSMWSPTIPSSNSNLQHYYAPSTSASFYGLQTPLTPSSYSSNNLLIAMAPRLAGWSLPTSPYLHSTMQAWSAQLPMTASVTPTEMGSPPGFRMQCDDEKPRVRQSPLQVHWTNDYTNSQAEGGEKTISETQMPLTKTEKPKNTSSSASSPFRFFTLPIFCTLRRWQKQKKEKKQDAKRSAATTAASVTTSLSANSSPQHAAGGGGGGELLRAVTTNVSLHDAHTGRENSRATFVSAPTSLAAKTSPLPGVRSRFGFSGHIAQTPTETLPCVSIPHPLPCPPSSMLCKPKIIPDAGYQFRLQKSRDEPSLGTNSHIQPDETVCMHCNLPTTKVRPSATPKGSRLPGRKECQQRSVTGDRGSSGYESYRNAGSEVSSSQTDSIDSCCSGWSTRPVQGVSSQDSRAALCETTTCKETSEQLSSGELFEKSPMALFIHPNIAQRRPLEFMFVGLF
nr:unnamed protein product [Spirometra erinaceieuropaei]